MSQSSQPLYEVRNVSKHYGSVKALENVSLSIHAGEVAVSYTHLTLPTNREV